MRTKRVGGPSVPGCCTPMSWGVHSGISSGTALCGIKSWFHFSLSTCTECGGLSTCTQVYQPAHCVQVYQPAHCAEVYQPEHCAQCVQTLCHLMEFAGSPLQACRYTSPATPNSQLTSAGTSGIHSKNLMHRRNFFFSC